MITIGSKAPQFTLPDQDGTMRSLAEYAGKKVLLYFYPKDDTPGCTTEACNFRDGYEEFEKLGLVIVGISKDSVKSHKKFAEKFNLPFPLLSDATGEVVARYESWGKKKFMGREYMGIFRNSFLIDEKGVIVKIYKEVKAKEHADEVKEQFESRS